MATEFRVLLADQPGTLASLGHVLGDARVNIEAIHGWSLGGTTLQRNAVVQFVPNDVERTARALDAAGIAHTTREVLVVKVLDQPGMIGDVALVMSTAGINIDSVYVTTHGLVVLGVDDIAGATQVAAGMAVMSLVE